MDRPLINPNWLTSTTDLEVGVEAFKRARMIAEGSGIAISEAIPGSAVQSDEEIANYIRGATVPIHHAAATCKTNPFVLLAINGTYYACQTRKLIGVHRNSFLGKMGQRNDTMAVADSEGRVFGVSNLRVADISAFPLLPPGHPQATVCKCSPPRYLSASVYILVILALCWPSPPLSEPDMLAEKIAAQILSK